MAKIDKDKLGYLGFDFQVRLIAQIITDNKFATSIIDIVDPNYFEDPYLRIICAAIKDAYSEYEIIPDMGSLEFRLLAKVNDDLQKKYVIAQLRKLQEANLNDSLHVQDIGLKFCVQQELKKSLKQMQKIVEDGDFDEHYKLEEILRNGLEFGQPKEDDMDVFDGMEEVMSEDFRKPIPTGISGLDEVMCGGLSKGELAIVLAALGVGKTTMLTKIANTAKNLGHNVLQIYFEDMPKVIKRKHLSCWSGISLNDIPNHKEYLTKLYKEKQLEPGVLKLKKFSSVGTTMPMIRQYIRKKIAQGFKPDVVILDYIDVVATSKHYDDANIGEGSIMREFEALLDEFNIAGWVATQGNRCVSLDTDIQVVRLGKTKIKNIIVGDEILTHKGYKKVSYIYPIQKQAVYKIKTKTGREIKVSKKHFFPISEGIFRSIESGLSIGDKLLIKK